ncbi:MAG TPA: hypothetical protein VF157_09705 [Chloroflexota bacterium]
MKRINELIAERQALFSRGANGLLPEDDRARMKDISAEITRLWDEHRRAGHPPATPPVDYDWERPRRGRKPKSLTEQAA